MRLGELHQLLKRQLRLEHTRPELSRIQETSAGNPFFAIELGRELVRTKAGRKVGGAYECRANPESDRFHP